MLRIRIVGISLVVICLAVLAIGGFRAASKERKNTAKTIQVTAEPGTWEYYAQMARSQGKTEIYVSGRTYHSLGSDGRTRLKDAISDFSVVVASPIERKFHAYDRPNEIGTWYKFQISESLLIRNTNPCPFCGSSGGPSEMLPLKPNEFLFPMPGGEVVFDDIKMIAPEPFGPFEIGKKYLLFIVRFESGVADIAIGPPGIFIVGADNDSLVPMEKAGHHVQMDIDRDMNNSLEMLREYLRN